MKFPINVIRQTRFSVLNIVDNLSIEQLNKIPEGFNNNIVWNVAHLIAAQQGVCYGRAGLPKRITDSFFEAYKPDTKPKSYVFESGFNDIKQLLLSTVEDLEADYNNSLFTTSYPTWTTRYGVNIASIEEAISFLPFHEGLHMGYIMALKRAI